MNELYTLLYYNVFDLHIRLHISLFFDMILLNLILKDKTIRAAFRISDDKGMLTTLCQSISLKQNESLTIK